MLISVLEVLLYLSCLVEEMHKGVEFAGALAHWCVSISEGRAQRVKTEGGVSWRRKKTLQEPLLHCASFYLSSVTHFHNSNTTKTSSSSCYLHRLKWEIFLIFSISFLFPGNCCPSKTMLWKREVVRTPSWQRIVPVALGSSSPVVTLDI